MEQEDNVIGGGGGGGSQENSHSRLFKEHPLLNPLIMANIFEHLESSVTLEELRNLRGVCNLWRELTLSMWRSRATLTLGPPEMSVETRRTPSQSLKKYLPVNTFIEMALDSTDPNQLGKKMFNKFTLYGVNFISTPDCLKPNVRRRENRCSNLWVLFEVLGVQVEAFKFEDCTFSGNRLDVFEEILTKKLVTATKLTLSKNNVIPEKSQVQEQLQRDAVSVDGYTSRARCPNLKTLEMNGVSPIEVYVLLMDSPNLESWTVRNSPRSDNCYFMILQTLYHSRGRNPGSFQITELDVMESRFFSNIWLPIVPHLRNLDVPLKSISLTIEPHKCYHRASGFQPNDDQDIIHVLFPIISNYQRTLKVLKVFRPPVFHVSERIYPFCLLRMYALTELHLWGNVVDSFSFLSYMPALKVLYVNFDCLDKAEQLQRMYCPEMGKEELEKFQKRYQPYEKDLLEKTTWAYRKAIRLENMVNLCLDCPISSKTVKFLAGWMPNLKVFKGNFRKDILQAIFKLMPNLEELIALRRSHFYENALTGHFGDRVHEHNITGLKSLKRFQMNGHCGGTCSVTNHAVYNGFLKMLSLESLSIRVSQPFSKEAETALRSRISRVTIIPSSRNCRGGNSRESCDRCSNLELINQMLAP